MIKYFYKNVRTEKLQIVDDYKPGCWAHVEAPSADELAFLVRKFNLDKGLLVDALDENEMPRLERRAETSYIFVRFADKRPEGDFETLPLLFIFGEEILITVSLKHLPSLDDFLDHKIEFVTTERAKLVLQILQQMSEHYDTFISATSKQIKLIRSRLRNHAITGQDFIDFVTIEDELNEFLASLQPTNATLRRLQLGSYASLFEEDQDIVQDILLNNEQSIEACNANTKSIANIRKAYTSISSHNLNRTIKILTIATVMLNIPNVFYQMYGMNMPLPLQDRIWAFPAMISLTIVLVLVVFVIGRRKRIF